jgi:hypothetical protein
VRPRGRRPGQPGPRHAVPARRPALTDNNPDRPPP